MGLEVGLETLKTSKPQIALVAGIISVAPHGWSGVPSEPVAFRGGDLDVRRGGAQVCDFGSPFVVGQRDVLVVLLYVLGELEE